MPASDRLLDLVQTAVELVYTVPDTLDTVPNLANVGADVADLRVHAADSGFRPYNNLPTSTPKSVVMRFAPSLGRVEVDRGRRHHPRKLVTRQPVRARRWVP